MTKINIGDNTVNNWFSGFYFSIVTFSTLGYGDITPANGLDCFGSYSWIRHAGRVSEYFCKQIRKKELIVFLYGKKFAFAERIHQDVLSLTVNEDFFS